jgi:hypothetical protein
VCVTRSPTSPFGLRRAGAERGAKVRCLARSLARTPDPGGPIPFPLSRNHAVEPGCFRGDRELKPAFSGTRSRRGATPERSRGFQPTEKGNRGFSVAERRLTLSPHFSHPFYCGLFFPVVAAFRLLTSRAVCSHTALRPSRHAPCHTGKLPRLVTKSVRNAGQSLHWSRTVSRVAPRPRPGRGSLVAIRSKGQESAETAFPLHGYG